MGKDGEKVFSGFYFNVGRWLVEGGQEFVSRHFKFGSLPDFKTERPSWPVNAYGVCGLGKDEVLAGNKYLKSQKGNTAQSVEEAEKPTSRRVNVVGSYVSKG